MQVILVFAVLIGSVVLFASEALPIDLVAVLIMLALMLLRILTPAEAFSGFSDEAVLTIASFFVISAALLRTGVVEAIGRALRRTSKASKSRFLTVLMLTASFLAAFLSNVATTAVLMPAVIGAARRLKQPVSQFLMPLAFAALLGGKATLAGSSVNLAVNGLMTRLQMQPFSLFEFTPLGVPLILAGIAYMLLVGTHLLPRHDADLEVYDKKAFVSELVVLPASPLAGKTLVEADFRGTYDLQILGIVHEGRQDLPHRDTRLHPGDILLVKGNLEQLLAVRDAKGLDIKSDKARYDPSKAKDSLIVEAILSPQSGFVGRTLKQIRFGSRYGADVLGIYRHRSAIDEKLGDVRLEVGDVLVIQGTTRRIAGLREDPNFLTLDDVEHTPLKKHKAQWAVAILVLAMLAAGFKLAPISVVALSAAVCMFLAGCITVGEAYQSIDWTSLVLIASTIPLGVAMEKTGAANILAGFITHHLGFGGPMTVLTGFFVFTILLTQPMSNAACALIVTPIAVHVAQQLHVNPRSFAITICIAASCNFATPLEPVTAIVYGPGRYRFSDYLRVGGLLTVVVMITTLLLVPIIWPLR